MNTDVKAIPESEWQECPNPNCNNSGGYPRRVRMMTPDGRMDSEWEQEQCQFCWTVDESVFMQETIRAKQEK